MIMINLLPWRENLRRKRRRKIFVGIGIALGMLVVLVVIVRGCVESRLKNAEREFSQLSVELKSLKQEFELRDWLWADQKKWVRQWEEQQSWQKKFACQEVLLKELAVQIPRLCRVEKTEVNSDRWRLVIMCQQEVDLPVLVQSMLALSGLSQMKISQIEIDEKRGVFHLESNAVLQCE